MERIFVTQHLLCSLLRPLAKDAHKGSNGLLNIVAGSKKFRGAGDLCVGGALRTGCGIVRLISCEEVIATVASRHPTCTFLPFDGNDEAKTVFSSLSGDTYLIGCGLDTDEKSREKLIAGLDCAKKCVLDADALNIISKENELMCRLGGHIITPHIGEFSRLTALSVDTIKSSPEKYALEFSAKYGCVTVLKDHVTCIATPDGRLFVSDLASRGLSKGGSGDVLAGLIAGFYAQGYSACDSAAIGVATHALASQMCGKEMGERSMLPCDIELYVARLFALLGY